ncbi:hypothetical protein KKF91_04285, partial [Myxococcota bacterium]|nr:hypothetical protein [Myxococcota bacterium]
MSTRALSWLALGGLLFLGCGEDAQPTPSTPEANEEALILVEPGKEDNFLSASADEYELRGETQVEIEAEFVGQSYDVRYARAVELAPYRQVVIGWFLGQYMVEKSDHDDNKDYGGFKALTKNGSWESLEIKEVSERVFSFQFRQEIAGPQSLVSMLPTTRDEAGQDFFELTIGKISTQEMQKLELNREWYRQSPWSSFNPKNVSADRLETVKMSITKQPRSPDAWFDYLRLIDDGILDIGVHFGWDYHKEYHRVHSKAVYDHLIQEGFKSPVDDYAALRRDSGPLTKSMLSPIGPITVKIALYWGEPGTETDPDTDAGGRALEADMRESLGTRDIIVFSGHSGPFYGFALANWRKTDEGDLDDSEIPGVEMPADRYQVVLAEGCDTYGIGQAFFLNPSKADRANLDIITTTSFSNASTADAVKDFLNAFIKTGRDEAPTPPRLMELLKDLDGNSYWFTTMYGVHGIDDNPRAHPWADKDMLCGACDKDADCGAEGNRCVDLGQGNKVCTFECTADDACPEDYICQATRVGSWMRTKVCMDSKMMCKAPEPEINRVIISLVVP